MTIQVNVNLGMHPTCVDLVFPDGVPSGGSVQLNLHRASSRVAYVNERECVPVVRPRANVLDRHYLEENITVHAAHPDDGHPLCFVKQTDSDATPVRGVRETTAVERGDERQPTVETPPTQLEAPESAVRRDVVDADQVVVVAELEAPPPPAPSKTEESTPPEKSLAPASVYVCAVCHFQTRSKEEGLQHVKQHVSPSTPVSSPAAAVRVPVKKPAVLDLAAAREKIIVSKALRGRKKAAFKCTECSKEFPADGLLRIHMRVYHGGPLLCKHCSAKFRTERELDKHLESEHPDRAPYRCPHCESTFFKADLAAVHEYKCPVARQQRQMVACQLCDFKTSEASNLCQHIQETHSEKVIYTCEPCGHLSLDFGLHQEHLKSHRPGESRLVPPQSPAAPSSTQQGSEPPVQCPLCKKDFKNNRTLKEHIKRHPKVVRHMCELCGEGITTNAALIKHLNRHNKELARKYRCLFCSKCFQTTFSVSRHMKNIHLFDHEHGCDLCPHKFATVKEKADHMAKLHVAPTPKGKRMHSCSDCSFATESLGRFERHRASHTGVYPYECTECPRRFAAKEELSRHRHIIHPKGQQSCPQCPRLFQDQVEFETHLELHQSGRSHGCETCGHHFESAEALREHGERRHAPDLPFECRLCHQRFCNIGQRVTHVRKYHPRVLLKSHVCDVCGSAFRYQSGLAVHKLDKHTGRTQGRLFECEYCGKVFGRSNVLAMHLRLHTGEQPYLCQHCGLTFRNPTNLKYHTVNMHTKDYAVSCPICARGFVVRRKLAKHLMQVHKVVGMVNTSSRKGRAKPVYIEHATVPVVSAETGDNMVLNVMQIVDTGEQAAAAVTNTELNNAVAELDAVMAGESVPGTEVTEESLVGTVVEETVEMVDIAGMDFTNGATVECYTVS